ncbi:hypothetical protein NE237_012978 [Protea cynaroides]|uniref:Uncharacterized protein n=1 Tax=Protea cynaroides TaxID=273540 RepID=A0A9Q0JZC8_9MAGN|nr:hypothetical protein NE237_012978 [Protea cynaroides]
MAKPICPSAASCGFSSRLRCLSLCPQPTSAFTELASFTVFSYRESRFSLRLRCSLALGGEIGDEQKLKLKQRIPRYSVIMASSDGRVTLPLSHSHAQLTELNEESDFMALFSPDGYLSICGFGSLLSERSARSTFPDLVNFRVAKLNGFRRVFAHAAPMFFERGIANSETGEISSLSVEPCEGETLIITVFEIKQLGIPSFIEREHEFRFLAVVPETLDGIPFTSPAVLCARYSDEEYFHVRCEGNKELYFQRYGRYNIHQIWRDDILPCRVYLRHCVLAAKNLGDAAYDDFLDHTFLGDRKTTIRQYFATRGSGIMEEEPPEPLKIRYGG